MCLSLIRKHKEVCKNRECVTCKKLGERCNKTREEGELFCKAHLQNNVINELFNPRENSPVKAVMTNMVNYIASPYNFEKKTVFPVQQYMDIMKRFEEQFPGQTDKDLCNTNENREEHKPYKILCKIHAGDLYDHSQWTALQILRWFLEEDKVVSDLDLDTPLIAAFFHDIGKGGDCMSTCMDETCWLDIYSKEKYEGKGEAVHPVYSGEMLLGKRLYKKCGISEIEIDINSILKETFPQCDMKKVALAAYMHWEFGKLNIPGTDMKTKCKTYLDLYKHYCKTCNLQYKDPYLIKLCIAVACADISGGVNTRVLHVGGIKPEKKKYYSKDAWVLYGMEKKYLELRDTLLTEFTEYIKYCT